MEHWAAGDGTIAGALLTAAYLLCGALSGHCARRSAVTPDVGVRAVARALRRRRFWIGAAAVLILLGVERQLGLLGLLGEYGRAWLVRDALYDDRRAIQWPLVLDFAMTAGTGLAITLVAIRRGGWPIMLALTGIVFLLAFALIRAISYHDVDAWLHHGVFGIAVSHLIELGGLALTAAAALGFSAQVGQEHRVEYLRARAIAERRRLLKKERRAAKGKPAT